ncbi:MAG: hypothetical protein IJP72_04290 [Bacteroidales bacterium]|nr:hypothetical protein [Bacteroidales bacterium]
MDPMADKYPGLSPYTYCADNPVRLVDPDGREIWLIGTEEERNSAFNEMQNGTNLSIGMDGDGHIYSTGETKNGEGLSRADKKLLRAINDNRVNVYIDICSQPSDVQNDAGGAYMGTEYYSGTKTASSNNHVNLDELWITEMQGKEQHGRGIIHEATEGYAAGLIAIKKETSIKPASFHFVERMYKYSEIGIDDNGKMVERTTKGVDPIKVYDYPTDAKYYKKAHRWAVRVSL